MEYGPTVPFSQELHARKYRGPGEDFRGFTSRVAGHLKDDDHHFHEFRDVLADMRFMPGGRIQSAAGSPKQVTAYNCFVSGVIHDSFVHGSEQEGFRSSIMGRASEAATTMRMGGGIGFDFCVDPDSRILMADLTWRAASDVREGERIVGFDEDAPLNRAKLREAVVESNAELTQPRVRVDTDRGPTVVSATHMFRARPVNWNPKRSGDGYRWIAAEDLRPGDQIAYCIAPWAQDDMDPRDAGWLAGILDGEGCVSVQTCPSGATKGFLSVAQNPGPVLDRILELLEKYGFEYKVNGRPKDSCRSVRFAGKWQALRALSLSQSVRLMPRARSLWNGCRISTKSNPPARVIGTVRLGGGRVMAMRTTTGTFIGDGFFSHNSTLRPRGGLIEGLQSRSCGPLGFMPVYSAVGLATSSTDHRRGAEMGVLRVDHPDIEAFVRAKNNETELRGFNLSIAVTHEFMEAKAAGRPFALRFGGSTHSMVDPQALWELIMRSTWDYAEPGVLFIDTINDWNNLWYCETIAATNPCGEQPLPPFGACLLGSFNLVRYVVRAAGGYWFDFERLAADVPCVVRAMDNVVDRTIYPLERQAVEARSKRRMGIGYTGLANAGEACGHPYGSPGFLEFERLVGDTIAHACYRASIELAREKGAFPLFDTDRYLQGKFIRGLPEDVLWGIQAHGIRNSHLTSIAPTGTISLAADNVSSGLEPVFAYQFKRTEMRFDGPKVEVVEDYGVREFGVRGVRTRDVSADQHVHVLATAQGTVDSACSKTCNVDPGMPWSQFKAIYDMAYDMECKGVTTYNSGGKRAGILVASGDDAPEDEGPSCEIDLETGRRSCD